MEQKHSLWHVSLFRGKCAFHSVSMYKNKSEFFFYFFRFKIKIQTHKIYDNEKLFSLIMSIQCNLDSHDYIHVCVFVYIFCGGIGRSQDEKGCMDKIMYSEVLTMKIEHVQTHKKIERERKRARSNFSKRAVRFPLNQHPLTPILLS